MGSLPVGISQFLIQVQGDRRHQLLEYAIAQGHGVEIADFTAPGALDDGARRAELVSWYRSRLREVKGLIGFHAAFRDLAPSAVDLRVRAASRDRVTECLDISEELGATYTVFHSDVSMQILNPESLSQWVQRQAAFWREVMAGRTAVLLLENCAEPDPEITKAALDAIGLESAGICFDPAHAHLAGALWAKARAQDAWASPGEWVAHLGRSVRYLHLSDNDLSGDQHLAPGGGTIDWEGFLAALSDCGLRLPAVIEVPGVEGARETEQYLCGLGS
jgi:sugar phosphate isomerase/epimerase